MLCYAARPKPLAAKNARQMRCSCDGMNGAYLGPEFSQRDMLSLKKLQYLGIPKVLANSLITSFRLRQIFSRHATKTLGRCVDHLDGFGSPPQLRTWASFRR